MLRSTASPLHKACTTDTVYKPRTANSFTQTVLAIVSMSPANIELLSRIASLQDSRRSSLRVACVALSVIEIDDFETSRRESGT